MYNNACKQQPFLVLPRIACTQKTSIEGYNSQLISQLASVVNRSSCLTDFLPAIVGSSDYDNAVNHVLDCLQNPKATRYILYICSAESLYCMQSDAFKSF